MKFLTGFGSTEDRLTQFCLLVLALIGLPLASRALTTNDTAGSAGAPAMAAAPSVALSPGALEVLKMMQAGVNPEVIKAYVKGSTTPYNLSALEIIELKRQGVADDILSAMLQRAGEMRAQGQAPMPVQPNPNAVTAPMVPPYGAAPDYGYNYGNAPYVDYGYGTPYYYPYYGYYPYNYWWYNSWYPWVGASFWFPYCYGYYGYHYHCHYPYYAGYYHGYNHYHGYYGGHYGAGFANRNMAWAPTRSFGARTFAPRTGRAFSPSFAPRTSGLAVRSGGNFHGGFSGGSHGGGGFGGGHGGGGHR